MCGCESISHTPYSLVVYFFAIVCLAVTINSFRFDLFPDKKVFEKETLEECTTFPLRRFYLCTNVFCFIMATTVGFLAPSPPVSSCEAAWREEADIEAAWDV